MGRKKPNYRKQGGGAGRGLAWKNVKNSPGAQVAKSAVQIGLDTLGFDPSPIGMAADLASAAISAASGQWFDAGLSVVSLIPGADFATKPVKLVRAGAKVLNNSRRASRIADNQKKIRKEVRKKVIKEVKKAVKKAVDSRKNE